MFYQILLSPQVERCAINTYNHGYIQAASRVAKLDLRELGNIRKMPKPHSMITQRPIPPPPPNENFVNTSKNIAKTSN